MFNDENVDSFFRSTAAEALGNLGDAAKPYVEDIFAILKNEKVGSYIRGYAVLALGNLGNVAKPYVEDIAALLKDEKVDLSARSDLLEALGKIEKLSFDQIPIILNFFYYPKESNLDGWRFQTYFLDGGIVEFIILV